MPEVISSRATSTELVPIDEVVRRFGLKSSALRYYERRGLISPADMHAGKRWYGPREIRRIAIIMFWQRSGLMSLEVIGELLDGSPRGESWQETVAHHVEDLRRRIEQMQQVEAHFRQALACTHDSLDSCPEYEQLISHASEIPPVAAEQILVRASHH
ncbi:MerR family transcriptional regulator [Rhodococcus sp. IEGM 1381]|uniref:MerR family transcriptional regulator n=1 Tax=Rhodococcus sp. IEGM 1381 TaxID=3047085 RepID=UPI0024B6C179|nr:MerR family transcriptional regulator [Rhodococcus sp. IEGM 1381]MDI9897395.1 MerR family transcriptional regulator [Rhodococcus sp. IEGM 1381]